MASIITQKFEQYIAQQTLNKGTVVFDEFIFANIPGLTEQNLANYQNIPPANQIVHRQAISQSGVINENSVVYSVTIGTEVGNFDFNFIGLINKSKNLLAVAVQTNPIKKIKNQNNVQGNSITRSILLEFSGAKALTGISVNANTWQIDFTLRLSGLDEKIRLTNRDLYGRGVFFDESFLVKRKTGNQFTINPGVAYVEGVRLAQESLENITLTLPCSVYVDVVHHCTVTGAYQTELTFLKQSKNDYIDTAGYQHYVQILADIDRQGNVTDRRLLSPFLSSNPKDLDEDSTSTADKTGHAHKLPVASAIKKGILKVSSERKSTAEDIAASLKGLKETNDNANNRVLKTGDTMTGPLKITGKNDTYWSSLILGSKGGEWRLEVHPDSAEQPHRRFNMRFDITGGEKIRLTFPSIGSGDTVAYHSWVNNNFLPLTGGTLTGNLILPKIETTSNGLGTNIKLGDDVYIGDANIAHTLKIKSTRDENIAYISFASNPMRLGWYTEGKLHWDGDYLSLNVKNNALGGLDIVRKGTAGNWLSRIEALPDKSWKFWTQNAHTIILPPKSGTVALDSDFSNQGGTNNYVSRDGNGDITARTLKATYQDDNFMGGALAFRVNNTTNNHTRYCNNPSAVRTWLGLHEIATRLPNAQELGFTQNISGHGWTKLPNGLIYQWGMRTHTGKITFPIAFNEIFSIVSQKEGGGDSAIRELTKTGAMLYGDNRNWWIAIGR